MTQTELINKRLAAVSSRTRMVYHTVSSLSDLGSTLNCNELLEEC